jgi:hypothetical protein
VGQPQRSRDDQAVDSLENLLIKIILARKHAKNVITILALKGKKIRIFRARKCIF